MDHFTYRDATLCAEDVPLDDIAAHVGTPFYVYSTATLERHYQVFSNALAGLDTLICFAVKANSNLAVIATLARLGAGADVVSGGELARALKAGVPPERIVFSGIGKTVAEMHAALDANIYQFNVESEPEVHLLSEVAASRNKRAAISFRVNPDVDARTHAKISTGLADNKFGIPWREAHRVYAQASALPGIEIVGVDVHIGSQLTELAPLEAAFQRVVGLVHDLRGAGHRISRIDFGGGLGIPYQADADAPPLPLAYGAMVRRVAGELGCRLIFEPGRLIVGNAGLLVARTLYVKQGETKRFLIVDAAMNDLLRPAIYDAYHEIVPVVEPKGEGQHSPITVVGPVCESADTFARDRLLPEISSGELIAFKSAGAYSAVMSSTYNTRPLVPEVLVRGNHFAVIRPRVEVEQLLALDHLPDWLADQ